MDFRYWFVKNIYGDHNDSKVVISALNQLFASMPANFSGLNVGAGHTKLHPNMKNLEIEAGDSIDIVGSIEQVPCEDESFDLIVAQEVLEHVANPQKAMLEIKRILSPRGKAFLQMPFIIGYHPCPNDYWRFSHEGMAELVAQAGLVVEELGITVGPATGFYRVAVEFWSVLFATLSQRLYIPAKAFFSLLYYPIKWLDPLMLRSKERNRIAGGFYVICSKRD